MRGCAPCGSSPARGRSSPAPRAGSAAPCAWRWHRAGRASGWWLAARSELEELVAQLPRARPARTWPWPPTSPSASQVAARDRPLRQAGRRARPGRRQRRSRPLRPVRRHRHRAGRGDGAGQRPRHDLHGRRGAPAHARPGPRPCRDPLLGGRAARLSVGRRLRRHQGSRPRLRRGAAARALGHRGLGHHRLPRRGRDGPSRSRAQSAPGLAGERAASCRRRRWPRRSSRPWRRTRRAVYMPAPGAAARAERRSPRGSPTLCSVASAGATAAPRRD